MGAFRKRRIQKYVSGAKLYVSELWVPKKPKAWLQTEPPAQESAQKSCASDTNENSPQPAQEAQETSPSETDDNLFGTGGAAQEVTPTEDVEVSSESDDVNSGENPVAQYDSDDYFYSVVKEEIDSVYEEGASSEAEAPVGKGPSIRYSLGDFYDFSAVSGAIEDVYETRDLTRFNATIDKNMNLTFTEKLQKLIREKGLRDPDIYRAANLDRRLFSKIMSDPYYSPSKDTVLAIAIAMCLSLDETNDLLARTGYSLSHSNKRDIVIEYFFKMRIWKLQDINTVLTELGERIIGRY